jgi:hypothetical protein
MQSAEIQDLIGKTVDPLTKSYVDNYADTGHQDAGVADQAARRLS